MRKNLLGLAIPVYFAVLSCTSSTEKPLFKSLPSDATSLRFNNQIKETDSLNILTFEYIYNGGGIGVGDVNNDGLEDLFFTGNMVSSKLYLNKGGFKFEDVTIPSGVATSQWCTGVSMIDINQDGLLDIYISTASPNSKELPPNLLFINRRIGSDGTPVFEEVAAKVGLADSSYCVQSTFLDYDLDGDLDAFLLTNYVESYNRNTPYGQHHDGTGKSVDKLFRNDGIVDGLPSFKNVSTEAGILSEGWGLGVLVNDINRDGYPDVYVANDFIANDHLYINNGNGTFTNQVENYFKHQEHDGMGIDIADINNDALNDVIVLDMMPEDNLRQKAMFSNSPYDRFYLNLKRNYQTQYVRNVLQLNNGNGTFSDIGYLAGVYATDWSWSSLLADFDNDGYRDLFITNGFPKDITDLDFVSYSKEAARFGTSQDKLRRTLEAVEKLEGVKKPNYLYRNNGDLTFTNKATQWGLNAASFSTGATYADFDSDGDLDLVVNNINDDIFFYENRLEKDSGDHNFLRIKLNGRLGNREGLGAKIWVYAQGSMWYAEHELQRGYQSSVESTEHFGLGKTKKIDSVKIVWQSQKMEVVQNIATNQVIALDETNARKQSVQGKIVENKTFSERHAHYNILFKAKEEDFVDYKQGQPLLLHKHSQGGPGISVGDINSDGLEDFIIGGAAGTSATIFQQQPSGIFLTDSLPSKVAEDMGMLLLDVDSDQDLDLYCVSGSSEFGRKNEFYQDRLYRNNGQGNFELDPRALPVITASGGSVSACDFDKDGDLDLFVGGRILPSHFPESPQSYLLQNDGKGNFSDITKRIAPDLTRPGMITSCLWTDFDNDGWTDLALVGEWMPVTFYKNLNGKGFEKTFNNAVGWWNSITGGDADNDGDIDYVVGNLGRNSLYQASVEEPVSLYAKDFDDNGSIDPIVTRFIQGKEYPTHYRESMTEQMGSFRKKLPRYATYGNMTFKDLMSAESLNEALVFKATWFSSAYLENKGDGLFDIKMLPVQAQFSPLFGIAFSDVNLDGNLDILGVGNCYASEMSAGFYDAGIGVCLLGDGEGNFESVHTNKSGFFVDKDAKALALLNHASGKKLWLVTNNNDSLQVFEQGQTQSFLVQPEWNDAYAEIVFTSGKRRRHEFYFGNGYLSQGSRNLYLPLGAKVVHITKTDGSKRQSISGELNRHAKLK
jgi:enediyne biosynthesis protein E4